MGTTVKSFRALLFALIASGASWIAATPAQALLGPGCSCPAGYSPAPPPAPNNTCSQIANPPVTAAAICPAPGTKTNAINQSVGQIAASQQQMSFWGVETVLQQ